MRRPNLVFVAIVLVVVLLVELLRSNSIKFPPLYKRRHYNRRHSRGVHKEPKPNTPIILPKQDLHSFLIEMAARATNISSLCASGISTVTYDMVKGFVVADTQESLFFCPVFKAASSSWLIAMLQMKGLWDPGSNADELSLIRSKTYPKYPEFDLQKQSEIFRTRFMVSRHPLERLLSCYRDKYENGNKVYYYEKYGVKMMRIYRERPADVSMLEVNNLLAKVDDDVEKERALGNLYANPVGPTFTEFVKYVMSPYDDEEHWRPFHEHCAPCAIQYNFIMRFEDLDEEGPMFLQYLNASDELRQKKVNVFNGPPTVEVSCSYYSQLSKALLSDLVGKYRVDMDLFGYSPDIYLKCADEYVEQ